MKHIAVYMRVSTEGQNTGSQEHELRKYLTDRGIDPDDRSRVVWYVDTISGSEITRDSLSKLRDRARMGAVSEVICWKVDRLSRRMIDGINLICEWLDKDIAVVSITQQFDFRGPIGKAVAALLLALAEAELQNIRDRIKAGIARAKKNGKRWGGAKRGRKLKLKYAMTLRMMQRLWAEGDSVPHIAKMGGVSRQTVYKLAKENKDGCWATQRRNENLLLNKQQKKAVRKSAGDQRRTNEIVNFVADAILKPEEPQPENQGEHENG